MQPKRDGFKHVCCCQILQYKYHAINFGLFFFFFLHRYWNFHATAQRCLSWESKSSFCSWTEDVGQKWLLLTVLQREEHTASHTMVLSFPSQNTSLQEAGKSSSPKQSSVVQAGFLLRILGKYNSGFTSMRPVLNRGHTLHKSVQQTSHLRAFMFS